MKTADEIINWYKSYEKENHNIEDLLDMRRRLSCYCVSMADILAKSQNEFTVAYHDRRLSEASRFLSSEGSVTDRQAKMLDGDARKKEGYFEGEMKAIKSKLDAYYKVLDSMASYINFERR